MFEPAAERYPKLLVAHLLLQKLTSTEFDARSRVIVAYLVLILTVNNLLKVPPVPGTPIVLRLADWLS